MKTYVPRDVKVTAIQYTGTNRRQIITDLGISDPAHCQRWYLEGTTDSYLLIENEALLIGRIDMNQWVVKHNGTYSILSDEDFRLKYEEWPV